MNRTNKALAFGRDVFASVLALPVGVGSALALGDAATSEVSFRQVTSPSSEAACGCNAFGTWPWNGTTSSHTTPFSRPTSLRKRVFTKILDGSSCGGFGGGTCFATDNSVCYLEITCNDDGCIMDCA